MIMYGEVVLLKAASCVLGEGFMLRKIIKSLLVSFVLIMACHSVSLAENQAADYYRNILQSGKFYLKYTYKPCDDKGKFIKVPLLGDFETKRYIYAYDGVRTGTDDWDGRFAGNTKKYAKPFRYMNGNYYFIGGYKEKKDIMSLLPGLNTSGKKYKTLKAVMMTAEDFEDFDINKVNVKNKNIKWLKGLNSAYEALPLPEELSVLCQDALAKNKYHVEVPQYIESSEKTIKGKTYECDRYITIYTDEAGNLIDEIAYDLLYLDGRLAISRKYSVQNGEILRSENNYEEISDKVTKEDVGNTLPIAVYRIGGDDMTALLNGQNEVFVDVIDATEAEDAKR